MVIRLVAFIVLATALASPAAAAPDGFYASPRLAPAASFVAGKPVKVWCAKTEDVWRETMDANGGGEANGLAVVGSDEMRLSPVICLSLQMKLGGRIVPLNSFAPSLLGLVHEAIHDRGSFDEGKTDCAAVHEMPRVAVKFFKVKPGKQLRAVMAAAWTYRDRLTPPYRTVC